MRNYQFFVSVLVICVSIEIISSKNFIYEVYASETRLTENSQKEFNNLLFQATKGDVLAQKQIAESYYLGVDVKRDTKKALYWYKQAAANGIVSARRDLGLIYLSGRGVINNYSKAYTWLFLFSMDNFKLVEKHLTYLENNLTKKEIDDSKKEAFNWLSKNANNGEPFAQFQLGKLYRAGKIVKKDNIKALKWVLLAQSKFSEYPKFMSSIKKQVNLEQESLMEFMTSAEIRYATKLTYQWEKEKIASEKVESESFPQKR